MRLPLSNRRVDLSELLRLSCKARVGESVEVERYLLPEHVGILTGLMRNGTPVALGTETTFLITDLQFRGDQDEGMTVTLRLEATTLPFHPPKQN